ncbi:MAG TPA: response regulator [Solirubrobacteraceae bacterium]|nr:response regulator [Solirubrobacteraceae bacterium]
MFAPQPDQSELRVLIVDDAPFYRRIVRELLTRRGYEVAGEAETFAAALRLAEALAPDAALVDVRLPDGDGFELAARLTQSYPWMAVLLTSSEFDHRFYALADASGARGFVLKPHLAQIEFETFWARGQRA